MASEHSIQHLSDPFCSVLCASRRGVMGEPLSQRLFHIFHSCHQLRLTPFVEDDLLREAKKHMVLETLGRN